MTKKERYQHYTVDPATGERQYYFPMEIEVNLKNYEPDTDEYAVSAEYKKNLKKATVKDMDGNVVECEVGHTILGCREIEAVFIPVSHETFKELIKDEMDKQDAAKVDGRCKIPAVIGGVKMCPLRVPNPEYVEGGDMPKTIKKSCEGCPHEKKKYSHTEVNFSNLCITDDDGGEEDYEPAAPYNYYAGDEYEVLMKKWCAYVRTKAPELEELAMLLSMEYIRSEAARELDKSSSTVQAQRDRLKPLLLEFLQTIAKM